MLLRYFELTLGHEVVTYLVNNALEVKIFSRMFSEEITFIFNYCLDVQEKTDVCFWGEGQLRIKI